VLKRLPAALAALLVLSLASGCGDDDGDDDGDASGKEAAATCTYVEDGQSPAKPVEPPRPEPTASGKVSVTIRTSVGDINAVLDAKKTPCTVNSFLSLAEQDFFDETPCPRLGSSPGFGIIQCGDPTGTTSGGPGYTIPDELSGKETYPAGTLAMANTGAPDSGGSQFFLVFADSQFPPSYTVFGTMDVASIRILQKVAAKGDDGSNPAGGGKPNQPVDIEDVRIR
jgi:peptidyl-prolyl cis-trans isomerase B (cyclophilin B)